MQLTNGPSKNEEERYESQASNPSDIFAEFS